MVHLGLDLSSALGPEPRRLAGCPHPDRPVLRVVTVGVRRSDAAPRPLVALAQPAHSSVRGRRPGIQAGAAAR